eukprot:Platyproteum_vivax@DN2596_c0_g1_i1.p1
MMSPIYYWVRSFLKGVLHMFFREVDVFGLERVPPYGPVIFVGNHSNQFVDAMMLISKLPRQVSFLIAASSMKRPIVGDLAHFLNCIPVERPQDMAFPGEGRISLVEGETSLKGSESAFRRQVAVGDKLGVLGAAFPQDEELVVTKIVSDTEVNLRDPCHRTLENAKYKVLPKVNQRQVYSTVTDHLCHGGCIGVFPEGGSHDRPNLLPLKPGVAIMTLSAMCEGAEDVNLVPVGLTYHQAHRFRSSAVIELGYPVRIPRKLAEIYLTDKAEAITQLMRMVEQGLRAVTVNNQDFEEQRAMRLCSSLYPPERLRLSPENKFKLWLKFCALFNTCRDETSMKELVQELNTYYFELKEYGVRDREVWKLKLSTSVAIIGIIKRITLLIVTLIVGVPISAMWAPLWLVAEWQGNRHRLQALKTSRVKIRGTDVMASYKIVLAMALVPILNMLYGVLFGRLRKWDLYGCAMSGMAGVAVLPWMYYFSIRQLEKAIPLMRSIRFLVAAILRNLRTERERERVLVAQRVNMQIRVREVTREHALKVSPTFLEKIAAIVPELVLEADEKRLNIKHGDSVARPANTWSAHEESEEIL